MPIIDGIEYTTKASLKEACRSRTNILANIDKTPKRLPVDQSDFWSALMAYNPRTQEKTAGLRAPFAGLAYRQNPDKTYRVEAQLGVMDILGNFLSLSWHNAIDEAFTKGIGRSRAQLIKDIKYGFRQAIKEQIIEERRQRLTNGLIQCEETGTWCHPSVIHIDHHPISFEAIAAEFLDCLQEDFGVQLHYDMIYHTHVDDPMHCRFKNPTIDQAWRQWHQERAQLRAVTASVNLSKPRQPVDCSAASPT
jgi:hypothetical protein